MQSVKSMEMLTQGTLVLKNTELKIRKKENKKVLSGNVKRFFISAICFLRLHFLYCNVMLHCGINNRTSRKTVLFCYLIERYYKPVESNTAATRHTATEYVKYSQCMPRVEMLIAWTCWIK